MRSVPRLRALPPPAPRDRGRFDMQRRRCARSRTARLQRTQCGTGGEDHHVLMIARHRPTGTAQVRRFRPLPPPLALRGPRGMASINANARRRSTTDLPPSSNDDVPVELRQSIDAIAPDPEIWATAPAGDLCDGGQGGSLKIHRRLLRRLGEAPRSWPPRSTSCPTRNCVRPGRVCRAEQFDLDFRHAWSRMGATARPRWSAGWWTSAASSRT